MATFSFQSSPRLNHSWFANRHCSPAWYRNAASKLRFCTWSWTSFYRGKSLCILNFHLKKICYLGSLWSVISVHQLSSKYIVMYNNCYTRETKRTIKDSATRLNTVLWHCCSVTFGHNVTILSFASHLVQRLIVDHNCTILAEYLCKFCIVSKSEHFRLK